MQGVGGRRRRRRRRRRLPGPLPRLEIGGVEDDVDGPGGVVAREVEGPDDVHVREVRADDGPDGRQQLVRRLAPHPRR